MTTELIFKLSKEPKYYNTIFSQNCEIEVYKKNGLITYDYDDSNIVGQYSNLRVENEIVLADIELNSDINQEGNSFGIEGVILRKNDKGEVLHIGISGVAMTPCMEDK